jgi:hypothetical protein
MKTWKTVLIFVLTVCSGLFLLNYLLEGIPGPSCNCIDSRVLDIECELACAFAEGCLGVSHGEGFCIDDECWTPVVYYCELEKAPGKPIQCVGWHCYVDCSQCEPL